ncbi:hypothetical protein NQ317_006990 [Molorchus minor]|uniref:RNase H type-1 domain-containing protein n=1 Tax=Molorchus minor TaxID=1323400 RepID=A0ABQ9IQP7_9CUCU|nr:hypothetical protein NQ317_006990 [Molorchus minor]
MTPRLQAEVYAILACGLESLKRVPNGRIIQICSESQAAWLAIESSKVKSRLALECKMTLNDLASRNQVTLTWVPGHSGVRGNVKADRLAREGVRKVAYWAGAHARGTGLNGATKEHIIEGPSLKLTKCLLEDPECRWCLEDEETSSHVFTECPAIARVREGYFGNTDNVKNIQPRKVCTFTKEVGIPG